MTNRRVAAFFWVLVFFLTQNGLHFIFSFPLPSLLLMTVIFYSLYEGPLFGAILGIYAGTFLDLFGSGHLGREMLLLGLAGLISGYSALKLFRDSLLTQLLLPVAAQYLVTLSHVAFASAKPFSPALMLQSFFSPVILETAIIAPFFFAFLKKIANVKRTQAFFGGSRF